MAVTTTKLNPTNNNLPTNLLLPFIFIALLALSQLTGTLVGYAINKDKGATTGYNISTSAEEYNRQLHEKEIEFIKKNAKEFAKKRFNTSNPTKNQIQKATKLLYTSAMYYNNKSSKL